jgi:hypothetical protein
LPVGMSAGWHVCRLACLPVGMSACWHVCLLACFPVLCYLIYLFIYYLFIYHKKTYFKLIINQSLYFLFTTSCNRDITDWLT